MKLRDLLFGKKQIKYLTANGFEVRMTPEGFKKFERDNKETLKHWEGLFDRDREPYYKTRKFDDFVVVYVGKDFENKPLLKYIEKKYNIIIKEI